MKKQVASVPFLALLLSSIICAAIVPYSIGRFIRLRRMLRRTDVGFVPSTSDNEIKVSADSIIQNAKVKNNTVMSSGLCQSLGIDIDELDQEFLQSSNRMESLLSKLIEDELFGQPYILREPRCGTRTHQRLHCDVLSSNSYLHIYTWPLSGTISIDVFSCINEATLTLLIPTIRNLVGIPVHEASTSSKRLEKSVVRWHLKFRGDRSDDGHNAFMNGDMDHFLYSYIDFELKEPVASIDTEYQTIDVYDTINPRFKTREQYHASLQEDDGTYYSKHPELFRPDRIIYLDGIMQSRYYGDAAYHETLVHPALFTHPNPKRVAIIGGGEGATLREVLKHNTIETVTMIEIDELMVNVSKQYIPEWSDCSMIVGSTPSCFDDPRAEVFYTDGIAWFIDRYLNTDTIDETRLYDIIIMDALDPESSTEFSAVLYDADDFIKSLSNSLRSDGILVTQLGENFIYIDPGLHYTPKKVEYDFMQNLIEHGFDRMEDYTESHGGFLGEWKFKIVFKCGKCTYSRWHSTQASVELDMKKRSMKCITDCNLFQYFDGATMMGYQYVSRVNEEIFCRDFPQKSSNRSALWCGNHHGYGSEMNHANWHSLLNQTQTQFEVNDLGHENADLVGGMVPSKLSNFSSVGLDLSAHSFVILPETTNLLDRMTTKSRSMNSQSSATTPWDQLNSITTRFGVPCIYWGTLCRFINLHSPIELSINESLALPSEEIRPNFSSILDDVVYNPFISRNHLTYQWTRDMRTTNFLAARRN